MSYIWERNKAPANRDHPICCGRLASQGPDARYVTANVKRPASCSATEQQRARAGRSDQPRAGILHYWQRAPASLSTTTVTFGWKCRMEAGTSGVTGPKKARRTISALSEPLATTRISSAAMMVPMPMV